mgnify:CR=1 FL=1
MNKLWKKANIPKTMKIPRKIERRKEEIRMLQVNKKTFDEARKITGLTTEAFARKLGLSKASYYNIKCTSFRQFTLKHILRAQDLSRIPIANFFANRGEQ